MAQTETHVFRKLLHLPIVGGREIFWTCIGANAIPVMKLLGIPENVAMSAFSVSAFSAIIFSVLFGFFSDRCSMSIGRRRPFIVLAALGTIVGTLCQLGSMHASSTVLVQVLIYSGFALQDMSLWAMQVPLCSYTLEVFSGREQQQMITGMVFFTGTGGILGFFFSSYFGVIVDSDVCNMDNNCINLLVMYLATGMFALMVILNIVSVPEKNLEELQKDGSVELETWKDVLNGYLNSPKCLIKLAASQFFVIYAVMTYYLWFTHCYAETIYGANLELIKTKWNISDELANSNFTILYDAGVREGAQIMTLFPLSAMGFSLLIEFGNLWERIGIRIIFESAFIFYISICITLTFYQHSSIFMLLAISLGYFLASQCTVPYMLIDMYRERSTYPKSRGLAADCAVISAFTLFGQVVNSLIVAQVIQWYGDSVVINPYSACAAFVGLLVAHFGVEYKNEEEDSSMEGAHMNSTMDEEIIIKNN